MKRSMQDFVNTIMCISSGQQLNEDSIKFSLSTQIRRVIKSFQADHITFPQFQDCLQLISHNLS